MATNALNQALHARRSDREFRDGAISMSALKRMIWAAQGKTSTAGGKTTPSAHALYPLRLYVSAQNVSGLPAGFYVVDPDDGQLAFQHEKDIRADLQTAAVDDQSWIGEAACIITICADFVTACRSFADQEPYGQRGARYVYIEAGAAAQNMLLQAADDALAAVLVAGFRDEATSDVLGLAEHLAPVLHICVGPSKDH